MNTNRFVKFVSAAIAITEECRGTALEMIQAHRFPFGRTFELHREFRVLVFDRIFPRVSTVHANESIEHQLQITGGSIPVDGTDNRPGIRQIQPRVHIQVPH